MRPWRCFWMGGFEGADHINGERQPLDMVRSTGHEELLDDDYRRAAALGLSCVRESIGWRLSEPERGRFDFGRVRRTMRFANRHGVQVVWTFMHYGTPPDVDLLDDSMIERFAAYAARAAAELAPYFDAPPVYNLINEVGFLAWAVSHTNLVHPYRGDPKNQGERTLSSGFDVKRRLAQAVLAAIEAVKDVDPRARFLHVEPVVHVVTPPGRDDLAEVAEKIAGYQWQAWDLIGGRLEPELGGSSEALDFIGVNYYHSGQWEVETEERLLWHEGDPRRRPFSELLADTWQRYRRPMIVAETSHFGIGRAEWLDDIAVEVEKARSRGIPVDGICLYPVIDRHDWTDATHWHHSGVWDAGPDIAALDPRLHGSDSSLLRMPKDDYVEALRRWQRRLPGSA